MTREEAKKLDALSEKVTIFTTELKSLVKNTENNAISNTSEHGKIIEHLAKQNGNIDRNRIAVFGNSADDLCILRRLSTLETKLSRLTDKWWWWVMIIVGSSGTGGILGQVVEGIWKRGTPL